jgi:hypothetical protein
MFGIHRDGVLSLPDRSGAIEPLARHRNRKTRQSKAADSFFAFCSPWNLIVR